MKHSEYQHTSQPDAIASSITRFTLMLSALLLAGSVFAYSAFPESDLADKQPLTDTQCRVEGQVASLLQVISGSRDDMIAVRRGDWSAGQDNSRAETTGQPPQPESIAFAALIFLTLALVTQRRKIRI